MTDIDAMEADSGFGDAKIKDAVVHIQIGGNTLEAMGQEFIAAWKRAEAGDHHTEIRRGYEDIETFAKVMTDKRLELLRHLNRHPAGSVAALARDLDRDYRRVHGDVEILMDAGLIRRTDGKLRVTAPQITVSIIL